MDGATGGSVEALWKYGALMVALYAAQRGLAVLISSIQLRTSVKLQHHLQGLVTKAILGKEYASLKPYHSGELVNRLFSDVSVIKNGLTGLVPTLLTTLVCFQYEDGADDVLIDVNEKICRGDFVAVTGLSGGGKTSLFQLMLGIYKPTSGRVTFVSGGKQVDACRGTRTLFAYVPQGNTLMSGTSIFKSPVLSAILA